MFLLKFLPGCVGIYSEIPLGSNQGRILTLVRPCMPHIWKKFEDKTNGDGKNPHTDFIFSIQRKKNSISVGLLSPVNQSSHNPQRHFYLLEKKWFVVYYGMSGYPKTKSQTFMGRGLYCYDYSSPNFSSL